MDQSRRKFFKMGLLTATGLPLQSLIGRNSVARSLTHQFVDPTGPFKPTEESLKQYKCPEWFRDAKFGIWAVWGPESVPQQGDWYARKMYIEGDPDYKDHLKRWGHPSKHGFKDLIPLWKAEKWEPEKLMKLYKSAGAKYFCMIAMHHDNFDCFNSKYQPRWNSVNAGPKRDIAGEWQQAAKKQGMRFGMTEHLAASWWFYGSAKGADKNGSMAGVPYDGNDPAYYDLYWKGNEHIDGHYYIPDAPDFVKETWYNRIENIIDRYHPDLLYSDSPLPFPDQYGRRLLCNLYNDSIRRHNGQLEVVYNCKEESEGKWIEDLERGIENDINPHPWQTDTCVGDWYYRRSIFDKHQYKTPKTIIHMLTDIVSKNGNLLLNFPPLPDGSLDDDELKILNELGLWMPVNDEAIFGTRPWKKYGEGTSTLKGGAFNEGKLKYSASDIRFTTKRNTLYAIALGWPDNGKITVTSLPDTVGKIGKITLLGHHGDLHWNQTEKALFIDLPDKKPCDHAFSFKVEGLRLS